MTAMSLSQPAAAAPERCPFHHDDSGSCRASVAGLRVEWRRRRSRCTSDDHDDCTLFLSRILRASRPQATIDPWPIHQK
jgi:hypothetical protein